MRFSEPATPKKVRNQKRTRTITAITAVTSLLVGGLVAGIGAQIATAAVWTPTVNVAGASAGSEKDFILAGEDARFEITVANPDGGRQFNLSATALLPGAVSFVNGGDFGAPIIFAAGAVLPNATRAPGNTNTNETCAALGLVQAPAPNATLCAVPDGLQYWVWSDVSDLPQGATVDTTITVRPDATVYPVGSAIDFNVAVYTSDDPTRLASFDGSPGKAKTNTHTSGRGADAAYTPTPVNGLRVTKTEPSREGQLLRGVHTNITTYTIKVEGSGQGAADAVTVTDYLPAGLEYLGVTGGDNSADGSEEYPGSGRIPGVSTQINDERVETVQLSGTEATALGLAGAGVYTKVTWTLPAFTGAVAQTFPDTAGTPGEYTFTYQAAVPLFANAMFEPGTAPSPESGAQAGNLDNNTGASTRHGSTDQATPATGLGLRNVAAASGTYSGLVEGGGTTPITVTDNDAETVEAVDLRVIKSVATDGTGNAFTTGKLATYSLVVNTSEYVNAEAIVLTDTIPNGLCPQFPANAAGQPAATLTIRNGATVTNYDNAADWSAGLSASNCAYPSTETDATVDNANVKSIEFNAVTGEFVVEFTVDELVANAETVVSYTLMQRETYVGAEGPTSSGDTLTNKVKITATTTPIEAIANDPTLAELVGGAYYPLDDSTATITSNFSYLTKQILQRGASFAAAVPTDWVDSAPAPFSVGDKVWYRIDLRFAAGVVSRDPILDDFLPEGVELDEVRYGYTNIPGFTDVVTNPPASPAVFPSEYISAPAVSGQSLTWTLGRQVGDAKFMPQDSTLTVYVAVKVEAASAAADDLDFPVNQAKYQQENVDGEISFLRDSAGMTLDWSSTLRKGIKTNSHAGGSTDATFNNGGTNQLVTQGDRVTYRIDVTAPQNTTSDYVVWDVLPAGVKAADIDASAYTAALYNDGVETTSSAFTAQAYDTLPAGIQLSAAYAGRSVVIFNFTGNVAGSEVLPAAITRGVTLGYTLVVPAGVAAGGAAAQLGQSYTNTAGIVSYAVASNGGGTTTAVPQNPVGGAGQQLTNRAPQSGEFAVSDVDTVGTAEVHLPVATMQKKLVSTEVGLPAAAGPDNTVGLTDLSDPQNTQTRIVQGEYATFEYSATIPAHSTVAGGLLADNGNFGATAYTFVPGSAAAFGPSGVDLAAAGFTLITAPAGGDKAGTLKFPASYTNTTNIDQVFSVRISVRVGDLTNNATLTNTAKFSYANPSGGARVSLSDTAQVQYVEPSPAISKTATPSSDVRVGDVITYRIDVSNPTNRPRSFDNNVVDTVPAGLLVDLSSFKAVVGGVTTVVPSSALTLTGNVALGLGGTIRWSPSAVAALGSVAPTVRLQYTAEISNTAAAGQAYKNVATVTGYTLPATVGGVSTTDRRGTRTATDDATVTATTLDIVKGVRLGDSGAFVPGALAPVGETASYEVSVVLHPNINYYNIQLRDLLPPGVIMVGDDGPTVTVTPAGAGADAPWNWTESSNRWTGTYSGAGGDILANDAPRTLTFKYKARLDASIPNNATTLSNEAGISWTLGEGGARSEVTDTATVTVANPRLVIEKKVDALDAITRDPDESFEYTVEARNTGNADAYNLTVTDVVPAGVIVDEDSLVASGGVLTGDSVDAGGGIITWTKAGPLAIYVDGAEGQLLTFTYTAKFADPAELVGALNTGLGATLTNKASVTGFESFDEGGRVYTPGSNGQAAVADSAQVTPVFPAVTLGKSVVGGVTEAFVGETFRWKLTATNNGQGAAQTVTLTDTLPLNWAYDDAFAPVIMVGGVLVASEAPVQSVVDGRVTLVWTIGSDTVAALPGTLTAPGLPPREITIEFAAIPAEEALQDAGAGLATAAHTNTVTGVTTDVTGASSNKTGSYTGTQATANAHIAKSDLKLTKAAIGGANGTWIPGAVAGGSYAQPQWQITITNQLPDAAHGPFSVIDTTTVPTGVTTGLFTARYFASAADTVGVPVALAGLGTAASPYIVGDNTTALKSDGTDRIVLLANVSISAAATGSALNEASVTGRTFETPEDIAKDNSDDVEIALNPQADMGVVKTASTVAPNAGMPLSWGIALTNHGPSVALSTAETPIKVTDVLPAGVNGVTEPAAVAGWTVNASNGWPAKTGDTITWTFTGDSIPVNTAYNFTLTGAVNADWIGGTTITNTASVVPGVTPDPVPGNNSATVTVTPTDATTVGISKTRVVFVDGVWKDAVQLGSELPDIVAGAPASYRVIFVNNGPADARDVKVTDTPPSEFTYQEHTNEAGVWGHVPVAAPGTGDVFSLEGTLGVAQSASFVVTYEVDDDMESGTELVNRVVGTSHNSNSPEDDDSNLTDRQAEVSIVKSVVDLDGNPVTEVTAGTQLGYRLVVTNTGPSISSAPIDVSDVLPTGMTFVEGTISFDGGTVSAPPTDADGILTWTDITDGETLAVGGTVVIDFIVDVAPTVAAQTLRNEARVAAPEDIDPANNVSFADVVVVTSANMSIVKDVAAGPWVAGTNVTYTISVTNDGPSTARATVTDLLPAGLTAVSIAGAGWVCDEVTLDSCEYAVHPLETTTITVVAAISQNVVTGTELTNTATLNWTDSDGPHEESDSAEITVTTAADLALAKVAVDADGEAIDRVIAGAPAWYTLNVNNAGPSDAVATLTVTDTLPAGVRFVSLAGIVNWTADAAEPAADGTQTVVFTRNPASTGLLAGTTAPEIRYEVLVDADVAQGAVLPNTAIVASGTPDPDDTNNEASASVTVDTFADLGITKTSDATPTAGEEYEWAIEVTNHGVSDSLASELNPIAITDVLPAGTTYVSAESAGATCTIASDDAEVQTLTCLITETMLPDDVVTVTLRVAVDEDYTGTITNMATVAPGLTPEPLVPVWPNQAEHVTSPVIEVADLAIEKTVITAPESIVAGESISWQLTVTNLGPSNSDANAGNPIVVSDVMPAGVTVTSVSGPTADWTCDIAADEGSFTCELATNLATNTPQVITVVGAIDASVQGTITNTATVAPGLTPQPEGSDENDTSSTTSTVVESADLRLLKDVGTDVVAGATGTYVIQIFNDGPSAARDVRVSDLLPESLTFEQIVVADGETSPWTCAPSATDPQEVLCDYTGTLVPSAVPTMLELEVSAAANLTGDIENVATVSSSTPDPNPENNTDTATGTFSTLADLVVTKTHDPSALATAGEEFTWTLTVTNDGPSDSVADEASPILVTDTLLAGTTFVAAGSSEACVPSEDDAQTVVCTISATMAAGESAQFDIRVAIAADFSGELENTATVAAGATIDPDLENNASTDSIIVTERADLTVAKTVATPADGIIAGQELSWTVTVTNNGPSNSDASEGAPITVEDVLPAGVSFVSASGDGWVCEQGDPAADGREMITCGRDEDLAVGDAPSITVTGLIAPDVQGDIVNTATVAPGETTEPDGGKDNNTATATATVGELADLTVTKVVSETIAAGGAGAYAFTVTNLGPSSSRGITLVDTLPVGLSFASAEGDGWTCAPSADNASVIECAYDGVLAPAASLNLVISVSADESVQGDITNVVTVGSTTPDPVTENNTASVTGLVAEVVDLAIVKSVTGTPVVGETFGYELLVTNQGPATARGVLVEDLVPDSLEILSIAGEGWECAADLTAGKAACLLGELAAGETASVISLQVRVLPAAYDEVSNMATVSSTTPEAAETMGDNTSTVTTAVPPLATLVVSKTALTTFQVGKVGSYEITIRNAGPTVDPGPITVTDVLPDGLAFTNSPDANVTVDGQTVTWTLADGLAVGEEVAFTVDVSIGLQAFPSVLNTVTVTSPTPQTDDAVLTDAVEVQVAAADPLATTGGEVAANVILVALALMVLGGVAVRVTRGGRRDVMAE